MKKTIDLRILGIAKKAGFIEAGEETVSESAGAGAAKLIIIASDSGESTKKRAKSAAEKNSVLCVEVPVSKSELGHCIGRGETGIVAVTDMGLAASFAEKIASLSEECAKTAKELKERFEDEKQKRTGVTTRSINVKAGRRRI